MYINTILRRFRIEYKNIKPTPERAQFIRQDEFATPDGNGNTVIKPNNCRNFHQLIDDFDNRLTMNPTQGLWFIILYLIQNAPSIIRSIHQIKIRELSINKFYTKNCKLKKLRAGEITVRSVDRFGGILKLNARASTFRFALAYTHSSMEQILDNGLSAAIKQNARQALIDFKDGAPLPIRDQGTDVAGSIIRYLASGEDLSQTLKDSFKGLSEREIMDLLIELLHEERRMHHHA